MKRHLFLLIACLLSCLQVMAQSDSLSNRLIPFVKGGLTVGLFSEDSYGSNSIGHTGYHIEAGVQIPFLSGSHGGWAFLIVPSAKYITKGDVLELLNEEKATVDIQYIEIPVDFAARFRAKKLTFLIGTGPYVSYGIKGRLTGSDRLYIFHGYRLKDEELDFFGPVVNASRWDAGINITGNVQLRHLFFSFDFDLGIVHVVPSRITRCDNSSIQAFSLGIGYAF